MPLKMFHHEASGQSPEFWHEAWSDGAFEDALRFCEVDPLGSLFNAHVPEGARMLEGGCGRGQYVAFHAARGVRVAGLDFERAALRDLKQRRAHLALLAGDVARLPFASGAFDVYYSGGVVEHFESGPEPALREAHRVLREQGVLLISVPYLSPLRRLKSWFAPAGWKLVSHAASGPGPAGATFFQYAFSPQEFKDILAATGFEVQVTQGYALLWGLLDLPGFGPFLARLQRRRASNTAPALDEEGSPPTARPSSSPPASGLIKRLVVSEDARVPILGLFVVFLRWLAANMMMYVCVRGRAAPPGVQ